jgi:hypothetical protein
VAIIVHHCIVLAAIGVVRFEAQRLNQMLTFLPLVFCLSLLGELEHQVTISRHVDTGYRNGAGHKSMECFPIHSLVIQSIQLAATGPLMNMECPVSPVISNQSSPIAVVIYISGLQPHADYP